MRALAAAGGDASRLLMVDQQVVDACLSRELKQQKDPLGEVEFEAEPKVACASTSNCPALENTGSQRDASRLAERVYTATVQAREEVRAGGK